MVKLDNVSESSATTSAPLTTSELLINTAGAGRDWAQGAPPVTPGGAAVDPEALGRLLVQFVIENVSS